MLNEQEIDETIIEIPEDEVKEDLLAIRRSFVERLLDKPEKAIEVIEAMNKMVSLLEQLREASIKATYPTDWVIHKSAETGLALAYLQDHGAERAGKPWGIVLRKPVYEREDFSDGTFIYYCRSPLAYSRRTGEFIENIEGARWSGHRFFESQIGPEKKVDPLNVRKAAYRNLHGRVVRTLAGLGSLPVDILKKAGLDTDKCILVEYRRVERTSKERPSEEAKAQPGRKEPTQREVPPSKTSRRGEAWNLLVKEAGMAGAPKLLQELIGKDALSALDDQEVAQVIYLLKEREKVPPQEKLIK